MHEIIAKMEENVFVFKKNKEKKQQQLIWLVYGYKPSFPPMQTTVIKVKKTINTLKLFIVLHIQIQFHCLYGELNASNSVCKHVKLRNAVTQIWSNLCEITSLSHSWGVFSFSF